MRVKAGSRLPMQRKVLAEAGTRPVSAAAYTNALRLSATMISLLHETEHGLCYGVRAIFLQAMDLDVEALKAKLAALKTEHRDLDDVIARITERGPFDQLQMQRLKKRKLMLKDQISKIESELLPDIIA
jgi:hypothetical protein